MIDAVRRVLRAIGSWSRRNQRRILPVAVTLFLAALGWAIWTAGIRPDTIDRPYFLFNALVMTPLTLLVNSSGLMISARALGLRLGGPAAVRAVSTGVVADLMPVPGSLAAHAGVLLVAGASPSKAGLLMTGRLVFLLGVALGVASLSLRGLDGHATTISALLGACVCAAGFVLLTVACGLRGALMVAAHRTFTFFWISARTWCAFASLGLSIALWDATLFAAAGIVGSAGFFTPGGLGIAEALGALVAPLVDADPAGAFAAMALNRILMFTLCGVIVLLSMRRREEDGQ